MIKSPTVMKSSKMKKMKTRFAIGDIKRKRSADSFKSDNSIGSIEYSPTIKTASNEDP